MASAWTCPFATAALSIALKSSEETWRTEIKDIFEQAEVRYPDIVWMIRGGDRYLDTFWGHKAILHARASSFSAKYPLLRSASEMGSLLQSRARIVPTAPTEAGTTLRVPITNSALLAEHLNYLYTGRMGAKPELVFDTGRFEPDVEAETHERLRKDLFNMWRSGAYNDIRIIPTEESPSPRNSKQVVAFFSGHRFILASRVPFLCTLLSASTPTGRTISSTNPLLLNLPSPPFTPACLYFVLGFIYTGTLSFSDRNWDLETAFNILCSAKYLRLDTLEHEIRARIVADMAHGLFHAYLPSKEYEDIIQTSRETTSGCLCEQCRQNVLGILEFALRDNVRDDILERGARRALSKIHAFGEAWTTSEFVALPMSSKRVLLEDVKAQTTPRNLLGFLQATRAGLVKLESNSEPGAESVKNLIIEEQSRIDEVLCNSLGELFQQPEWVAVLHNSAMGPGEMDTFEMVMESIGRGLSDANIGHVYQTLASAVLSRSDLKAGNVLFSNDSMQQTRAEQLRVDVIGWMRRQWTTMRMSTPYQGLDPWALEQEFDVLMKDVVTTATRGPSIDIIQASRA